MTKKMGRAETVALEVLDYIKNNSNSKGECTLTDEQIGTGIYGTYNVKIRAKINSCLYRLRNKEMIETKYSRVIYTKDD